MPRNPILMIEAQIFSHCSSEASQSCMAQRLFTYRMVVQGCIVYIIYIYIYIYGLDRVHVSSILFYRCFMSVILSNANPILGGGGSYIVSHSEGFNLHLIWLCTCVITGCTVSVMYSSRNPKHPIQAGILNTPSRYLPPHLRFPANLRAVPEPCKLFIGPDPKPETRMREADVSLR